MENENTLCDEKEFMNSVIKSSVNNYEIMSVTQTLNFKWNNEGPPAEFIWEKGSDYASEILLSSMNSKETTPSQLFSLFISNDLVERWAELTNNFKKHKQNEKIQHQEKSETDKAKQKRSHHVKWRDITTDEIKKYIAMILFMGDISKPSLEDYWSTDLLFETEGIKKKIISYDRFRQIHKYFCISDEFDNNDQNNPFWRVENFKDHIIKMSNQLYQPSNSLAVDESMVHFNGRHKLKQYLPLKPIKFGFKAFVLSESNTGYMSNFFFYAGNDMFSDEDDSESFSQKVVIELLKGRKLNNLHLYMDSYYTSVPLFIHLRKNGIKATGTINKNRKYIPITLEEKEIQNNQTIFYYSNKLTLCKWKDKKDVHLLSNFYGNQICKVQRRNSQGNLVMITCPEMIEKYTKYMRGVDRLDQLISYYHADRKVMRWWLKIFDYILEIVVTNAYIAYNKIFENCNNDDKMKMYSHKKFRREIIRFLLQDNNPSVPKKKISIPNEIRCILYNSKESSECIICSDHKKESGNMQLEKLVEELPKLTNNEQIIENAKTRNYKRKRTTFKCVRCNLHTCPDLCFSIHEYRTNTINYK